MALLRPYKNSHRLIPSRGAATTIHALQPEHVGANGQETSYERIVCPEISTLLPVS
jgi:hypothetical protein